MINNSESISFFMLGYGQPKATEKCLESVRKYYKNEKIIVFENSTNVLKDICVKYDAIHIHQPINYQKIRKELGINYACMLDINDFVIFMEQHKIACELTNTKWLLFLESDCLLRRKFEYFPNASIGGHMHSFNKFRKDVFDSINYFRKNNHKNKYISSFSGGSIVNRKDLLTVCQSNWKEHIKYAIEKNKEYNTINNIKTSCEIRCRDATLSYLFYINEFNIEDWHELTEVKHSNLYRATTAAMVHDFKYFYE